MPVLDLQLQSKTQYNSNIYFLEYITQNQFKFEPGQFISLEVGLETLENNKPKKIYRSYSIFEYTKTPDGISLSIMVSTKPDGIGSHYIINTKVGDVARAVGPAGVFRMMDNSNLKVFVATSTGLAPFLSMIKDLRTKSDELIFVYFGVKTLEDNFAINFLNGYNNIELCVCSELSVDNSLIPKNLLDIKIKQTINQGFVTNFIQKRIRQGDFQPSSTDFYLCGNPKMILTVKESLALENCENIYEEKFG